MAISSEKICSWTAKENKIFENALAYIEEDREDRWKIIAKLVGDKTAEQVEEHYKILLEDVTNIESGLVLIPNYDH